MKHITHRLYSQSDKIQYGDTKGVCRFTGLEGVGVPFKKWVKPTFSDFDCLVPGDIVSNQAMLMFDEKSDYIRRQTGKEKLQRFRTYSHFYFEDKWHLFTKAHKKEMYAALFSDSLELAVMAESGQKHLVMKYQPGTWCLEGMIVYPDLNLLSTIHLTMQELMSMGFNQTETITGNYPSYKLLRVPSLNRWEELKTILDNHRGKGIFDIAGWLLFAPDPNQFLTNDERKISSPATVPAIPGNRPGLQGQLF